MTSTSHSPDTLEEVIFDLFQQIKALEKENTDLLERCKDLDKQNAALRVAHQKLAPIIGQFQQMESAISRFFECVNDPTSTRREIVDSIVKSREKRLSIDSDSLPRTN